MVQFELEINWPRTAWIAFGVVLAAAVLIVLHAFVGTFVFGVFIYYATRRLHRRVRRHVGPPSVAAALSLTLLALPALVLLYYTVAIALQELRKVTTFLATADSAQVQPYLDVVQPYLRLSSVFRDPLSALGGAGGVDALTGTLQSALAYLGVVGTGLLHLFVMFALAFYLLRDGDSLADWGRNFTDQRGVLDHYFQEVDKSLDKVFYGNILNAVITGVLGAITFSTLNLIAPAGIRIPYPALTGLLAGVASLIPIVGMKLVYVPLAAYLAGVAAVDGQGWWFVALFAGVAFVVVDTIPDLVVRPYVSGGTLHVGALMFAYILGPLLFGWYGIFLGPIVLVLVVHFARIVAPELIAGREIKPRAVDLDQFGEVSPSPATGGDDGSADRVSGAVDAADAGPSGDGGPPADVGPESDSGA